MQLFPRCVFLTLQRNPLPSPVTINDYFLKKEYQKTKKKTTERDRNHFSNRYSNEWRDGYIKNNNGNALSPYIRWLITWCLYYTIGSWKITGVHNSPTKNKKMKRYHTSWSTRRLQQYRSYPSYSLKRVYRSVARKMTLKFRQFLLKTFPSSFFHPVVFNRLNVA